MDYEERIKLEVLCKAGAIPQPCIAKQLGERSGRTIRREIARGTVELLNSDF